MNNQITLNKQHWLGLCDQNKYQCLDYIRPKCNIMIGLYLICGIHDKQIETVVRERAKL